MRPEGAAVPTVTRVDVHVEDEQQVDEGRVEGGLVPDSPRHADRGSYQKWAWFVAHQDMATGAALIN